MRAAAVLAVPDARLGEVPVAVVEPRPGRTPRRADLLDHASGELARYEIPVRVLFVDVLPRTASGKVDLSAARRLAVPEEGTE
ncbi:AMP-binding enzyme [Actinomadura sp. CNU-125]|uniref:AMP-binding enzyme n=1 Tax=Actinomadura sp. CNU-125 TaxID=1904961 RepID=UPI0039679715